MLTNHKANRSALSCEDFKQYPHEDIGSGLLIWHCAIDDSFYLLIGGMGTADPPMYIRLVNAQDPESYIDIRTNDVEDWIETQLQKAGISSST